MIFQSLVFLGQQERAGTRANQQRSPLLTAAKSEEEDDTQVEETEAEKDNVMKKRGTSGAEAGVARR